MRKSVALDTATLKAQTVSREQVQAYRDSVAVGNPFARTLMDTGTGFLIPPPQGNRWDLTNIFAQFDTDGDGVLDIGEFQRAFRALGLKKRSGAKMEVDQKMFNAFDTNRDGRVSLAELEENLFPATRAKIEEKLDAGWKFDKKRWDASVARHSKIDMSKVFKQFDFDGRLFQRRHASLGRGDATLCRTRMCCLKLHALLYGLVVTTCHTCAAARSLLPRVLLWLQATAS